MLLLSRLENGQKNVKAKNRFSEVDLNFPDFYDCDYTKYLMLMKNIIRIKEKTLALDSQKINKDCGRGYRKTLISEFSGNQNSTYRKTFESKKRIF